MAPTDFLRLYNELGVAPEATLEELKRAYRRRVSELHPDRRESTAPDDDPERLQQLTVLYGAATDFHRRYGRLPGGRAPSQSSMPRGAAWNAVAVDTGSTIEPRVRHSSKIPWIVSTGLLMLGWFAFAPSWQEPPARAIPDAPPYRRYVSPPMPMANVSPALKIGMSPDDVRTVQGSPMVQDDDRWEYGPSWIAFEKKKVSDWYSSPLRPLKYASAHPPSTSESSATGDARTTP